MDTLNVTESDIDVLLGRNMEATGDSHSVDEGGGIVTDAEEDSSDIETPVDEIDIKTLENDGMNLMFGRISGAPWFKKCSELKICIMGAGGISSWTAMALSRVNPFSIDVYDNDIVSIYNISGQFYGSSNVGGYKSIELTRNVNMFSPDTNMIPHNSRIYDGSSIIGIPDVVVSGVDSMRSRKNIYNAFRNIGFSGLYIDGRLSADTLQVISFMFGDMESRKRYERDFMFDDYMADPTICSFKQTTYMSMMIASVICNIVVNFANNTRNIVEYRIPFFTEYEAIKMNMKTIL